MIFCGFDVLVSSGMSNSYITTVSKPSFTVQELHCMELLLIDLCFCFSSIYILLFNHVDQRNLHHSQPMIVAVVLLLNVVVLICQECMLPSALCFGTSSVTTSRLCFTVSLYSMITQALLLDQRVDQANKRATNILKTA